LGKVTGLWSVWQVFLLNYYLKLKRMLINSLLDRLRPQSLPWIYASVSKTIGVGIRKVWQFVECCILWLLYGGLGILSVSKKCIILMDCWKTLISRWLRDYWFNGQSNVS
jgi:hypothetical protein